MSQTNTLKICGIAAAILLVGGAGIYIYRDWSKQHDEKNSYAAASPERQKKQTQAALDYLKSQYQMECTAEKVITMQVEYKTYGKVLLKPSDPAEAERLAAMPAQTVLDNENKEMNKSDVTGCFAVFVDYDGKVVGDQYPMYAFYPMITDWVDAFTQEHAPVPVRSDVFKVTYNCKDLLEYTCFAPDFQMPESEAEMKDLFSGLSVGIDLTAASPDAEGIADYDWSEYDSSLHRTMLSGYTLRR